jgi:hypothetical protein
MQKMSWVPLDNLFIVHCHWMTFGWMSQKKGTDETSFTSRGRSLKKGRGQNDFMFLILLLTPQQLMMMMHKFHFNDCV